MDAAHVGRRDFTDHSGLDLFPLGSHGIPPFGSIHHTLWKGYLFLPGLSISSLEIARGRDSKLFSDFTGEGPLLPLNPFPDSSEVVDLPIRTKDFYQYMSYKSRLLLLKCQNAYGRMSYILSFFFLNSICYLTKCV